MKVEGNIIVRFNILRKTSERGENGDSFIGRIRFGRIKTVKIRWKNIEGSLSAYSQQEFLQQRNKNKGYAC